MLGLWPTAATNFPCYPSNRPAIQAQLLRAKRGEGAALFDEIVEIIRDHGPDSGGTKDGIHLELL
jgi:hypothetical protein